MMHLSPVVMNLIGGVLILTAIVIHIVCLATPHMAGTDSKAIKKAMIKLKKSIPNAALDNNGISSLAKEDVPDMSMVPSMNYGLWELCASMKSMSMCSKWTASEILPPSFKIPDWIRGAQAMSILGLLVAVLSGILAAIHLFSHSRGDRLRFLPLFICISAFTSGALILCGDIIIAAKYDSLLTEMFPNIVPNYNSIDVSGIMKIMKSALEDAFYLSWGFALDIVASSLTFLAGLFFVLAGRVSQESGVV